jgi:hypothetical protein
MSLVPGGDPGADAADPAPEPLARVFAPRGTRLHFSWGVGPQIRVAPVGAPPLAGGGAAAAAAGASASPPPPLLSYGTSPQQQQQDQATTGPCVLTTVAWSTPSMEQRRVAYDVLPLFRQIRRALAAADGGENATGVGGSQADGSALRGREALCAYARAVRRVLESARPPAPTTAAAPENGAAPAASPPLPTPEALQTLYEASAWHLLELLCLDPLTSSEGFFAEAFADWYARHGPLLSTRPGPGWDGLLAARLRLAASPRPDADPGFWPLAARLAALGRLGEAADVLLSHPAYRAPGQHADTVALLEKVYALLRRTPRLVAPSSGGSRGGARGGGNSSVVVDLGRAMDDPALFRRERAEWQAEAAALLRRESAALSALGRGGLAGGMGVVGVGAADPDAERGLRLLLSVCSGDESALRRAAGRNWLEFLVALLVWRYPDLRPRLHLRQLVAHAQAAVARGGGKTAANDANDDEDEDSGGPADPGYLCFLDDLIASAAELEAQAVVAVCTNSPYCGLWFVAHCYDLLRGSDAQAWRALSRPLPQLGCDQAEAYLLHYVDTLAGQASTWQLAAEYLAWCPAHGADALEALLERLPFPLQLSGPGARGAGAGGGGSAAAASGGQGDDDGRAAHKALALCARHGLSGAAAALCRRLGARCAELGSRGAALRWLLRAHDGRGVAAFALPLLGAVRTELEQRASSGRYALEPLDLPELEELAPVLDACLASGGPAEVAAAAGGGDASSTAAAAPPSANALAVAASTRPYPELQFLRCFMRLQRAAQAAQAAEALVAARTAEADAAADRAASASAGSGGLGCEAAAAAAAADAAARRLAQAEAQLCAAQAAARNPLLELVAGGLAAAGGGGGKMLMPLLLAFGVPLLEARFSPLSSGDVGALLAAGRRALAAGAGAVAGLAAAQDLQLALTRALARANVEGAAAGVLGRGSRGGGRGGGGGGGASWPAAPMMA